MENIGPLMATALRELGLGRASSGGGRNKSARRTAHCAGGVVDDRTHTRPCVYREELHLHTLVYLQPSAGDAPLSASPLTDVTSRAADVGSSRYSRQAVTRRQTAARRR
jgi:hypothetical protein